MRLVVSLLPEEHLRLVELAQRERRRVQDQAALLLSRALETAGEASSTPRVPAA
jgi:hypothetical protein